MKEVNIISLPRIEDERGNLSFLESKEHLPFKIKRIYYIYDVPGGQIRGSHAYKKNCELIIAISGSFDVVLNDGKIKKVYSLNRSYNALYVPQMIWRKMENFSTNSLCLIAASEEYTPSDYVRDYDEFLKYKNGQ